MTARSSFRIWYEITGAWLLRAADCLGGAWPWLVGFGVATIVGAGPPDEGMFFAPPTRHLILSIGLGLILSGLIAVTLGQAIRWLVVPSEDDALAIQVTERRMSARISRVICRRHSADRALKRRRRARQLWLLALSGLLAAALYLLVMSMGGRFGAHDTTIPLCVIGVAGIVAALCGRVMFDSSELPDFKYAEVAEMARCGDSQVRALLHDWLKSSERLSKRDFRLLDRIRWIEADYDYEHYRLRSIDAARSKLSTTMR